MFGCSQYHAHGCRRGGSQSIELKGHIKGEALIERPNHSVHGYTSLQDYYLRRPRFLLALSRLSVPNANVGDCRCYS